MTNTFTVAARPWRAAYLYAGQSSTGAAPLKSFSTLRPSGPPPDWLSDPMDLDFLDPSCPLFHVDRALYSFGPHLHGSVPKTMFSETTTATILGDSGGFQFIEAPGLFRGDKTRQWVLTTLEHSADEAMTLDIPTAAIGADKPWRTYEDARDVTVENLKFFDRHKAGKVRFLNVLQGRNRKEAANWLDHVEFFPGGGWAFGGTMRRDWVHVLVMLCELERRGRLGKSENRVHVLGVGDLMGAVMLSAIQRGMQERLGNPGFLITFDASSPSMLAANRQASALPSFNAHGMTNTAWFPPTIDRAAQSGFNWPFRHTGVGRNMKWGDLNVSKGGVARTAWDGLSEVLIATHNVEAALFAIDAANSIMELHPADAVGLAPPDWIASYNALRAACLANNVRSYLRPYKAELATVGGHV